MYRANTIIIYASYYARVVAAHQARAYLTDKQYMAAQKLAADEAAHVTAITTIITGANGTPVAKPNFVFPPAVFISSIAFLTTASALEETGVGAYLGAAPKVKARAVLRFAASVYGVECRHAGLISFMLGFPPAQTEEEMPLTVEEVQKRVMPFMAP